MVSKRIFLSGKVQGVSFRFHAHEVATKLKLHGWIRNLEDGRVEIVVSGSQKEVDQMIQWSRKGPPLAEVEKVQILEMKESAPKDPFFIRRDGGKT